MGAFVNNMIPKDKIMDIKTRRDIYQYISKNPGLNTFELSKKMNISRSTLRYHLGCLMKLDLIQLKVENRDKRLYASDQMGTRDKELLGLLRQEIPFRIIMYLMFPGFCSRKELAKDLGAYPSTIHFHLKKLLELGVIQLVEVKDGKLISYQEHKPVIVKKPVGREIFYMWKSVQMKKDVYRLLTTHKKSLLDPSIIDSYETMCREPEKAKNFKKFFGFNKTVDNVIKYFDEIFPSPYRF